MPLFLHTFFGASDMRVDGDEGHIACEGTVRVIIYTAEIGML